MDKKDYHFISLKFLTAILMALSFAFLLIYVFTPEIEDDYLVYSFDREAISDSRKLNVFDNDSSLIINTAGKDIFETELKKRSFEIMEGSKKAVLNVLTNNHLDRVNGLKEGEDLNLNELKISLNNEREELLQQKRQQLESNLSQQLQDIRRQVKEKYSGFSQQEIKNNYLKMINLRIAIEVLARDEGEKEKYQKEMEQVKQEQDKLLAEKNAVLNEDISAETRTLIMDFNREFANYREQLDSKQQKLIAEREAEVEERLAVYREEIRTELNSKREEKALEMDQLIAKSKEYY